MAYTIEKISLIPLLKFWIKKINGLDNVPRKGPIIIAANHTSYMDHLLISSAIIPYVDKKVHFLAKKEHFDGLFQRIWHNYVGAIPLDRKAGGKEALDLAVKALKNNKIIGIYPEGTRSLTGKLQKAKTGIARLALLSKAPVLPIGLIGTFEIMPKGKYAPKLRRAIVNIGKPLYFSEYHNKKINKKVLNEITIRIMKEVAKLSNQKYNFRH